MPKVAKSSSLAAADESTAPVDVQVAVDLPPDVTAADAHRDTVPDTRGTETRYGAPAAPVGTPQHLVDEWYRRTNPRWRTLLPAEKRAKALLVTMISELTRKD